MLPQMGGSDQQSASSQPPTTYVHSCRSRVAGSDKNRDKPHCRQWSGKSVSPSAFSCYHKLISVGSTPDFKPRAWRQQGGTGLSRQYFIRPLLRNYSVYCCLIQVWWSRSKLHLYSRLLESLNWNRAIQIWEEMNCQQLYHNSSPGGQKRFFELWVVSHQTIMSIGLSTQCFDCLLSNLVCIWSLKAIP